MNPDDLIRTVAGHGLTPPPADPVVVGTDAWPTLQAGVVSGRITGHLVAAVVDGAVALDEPAWDEALAAHRDAMSVALHLEQLLGRVVATCRTHGVDPIVLKGPAVAALDYPRPELRDFGDIDLLVPSNRMSEIADRFVADGCSRTQPELREGIDDRFGKEDFRVNQIALGRRLAFVAGGQLDQFDLDSLGCQLLGNSRAR